MQALTLEGLIHQSWDDRISIVYFTRKKLWEFTSSVKEQLVEYGSPVPGMDYQKVALSEPSIPELRDQMGDEDDLTTRANPLCPSDRGFCIDRTMRGQSGPPL